jgi:hypothetical protein
MVFGENFDRTDLSAWEWAIAFRRRRDRLRERGEPSAVRDVAASMGGRPFQTVGEYLMVADALSPEVLAGADLVSGGEVEHARLARVPLAGLLRAARAAAQGPSAAAHALLTELRRTGDARAAAVLATRTERLEGGHAGDPTRGLQLNIRQPLDGLPPRSAAAYLARLGPAVQVLASRAAPLGSQVEMQSVAAALERASSILRGRPSRDPTPE